MNRLYLCFVALLTLLISCKDSGKKIPQTDIDVATTFIRDILDNKLDDAEQFLLKDEANQQYFEIIKEQYHKKDKAELEKYKNADILVGETSYVSDTIYIFPYSNTYKRTSKNKLKLVRMNGKWLVDLKYTFSGNL